MSDTRSQDELLAQRLFDADIKHRVLEGEVSDLLVTLYGGDDGYDEFSHDYYDNSIEVYGVTPTQAAVDGLHAVGFDLVWEHNHKMGEPHKAGCGCPARISPRRRAVNAAQRAAKAATP